jgi:hypothetical protein
MPYLGKEPVRGSFKNLDTITPNGASSYSLLYNGSAYDPGAI